jgi:hypothetical protein
VPARASSKNLGLRAAGIAFELFGFHSVNCLPQTLNAAPLLTSKRLEDFLVPLSREETKVAGRRGIVTFLLCSHAHDRQRSQRQPSDVDGQREALRSG